MEKKILILTAAYPPTICGGADYIYKLYNTDSASKWQVYNPKSWKLRYLFDIINDIKTNNPDVINLQYPTMGYDGSIIPHILSIVYGVFSRKLYSVTIHECSQMGLKAKVAELFLLQFANKVIFTNLYELNYASRFVIKLKKKSRVIKIMSNIESDKRKILDISKREYDLVSFGLIRPEKGLEFFLETCKKIKEDNANVKIVLAGKVQPKFALYAESILKDAVAYIDEILLDKSENDISELLSNCKMALLPFPDGISERRGSAIAVLKNGSILITTKGKFTVKEFDACCEFASNPNEAALKIKEILKLSSSNLDIKQKASLCFVNNHFPADWEEIASQYKSFLI